MNYFTKTYMDYIRDKASMSDKECLWTFERLMYKTLQIYPEKSGFEKEENKYIRQMVSLNPLALIIPGRNDCITGICFKGGFHVFVYSEELLLASIREDFKTEGEAKEYFIDTLVNKFLSSNSHPFAPVVMLPDENDEGLAQEN